MTIDPFKFTSGDRDAEIVIVGEAWGAEEARAQKPFVGQAGQELDRMLFEAGLRRDQVLCTNIVDAQPNSGNDFGAGFTFPVARGATDGTPCRGLRANESLVGGIEKLRLLLDKVKPRLIIGTGNWPLWALTQHGELKTTKSKFDFKSYKVPAGIKRWRGSQTYTDEINGTKYPYLPIIHPAAILRDWTLRHITVHDLRARAARFASSQTTWDAPERAMCFAPSYSEARDYLQGLLGRLGSISINDPDGIWICTDIETPRYVNQYGRKDIVCIGIATDLEGAICVPFYYFNPEGEMVNVFNRDEEVELVRLIRLVLTHPRSNVTNQNIIFDAQILDRNLFIRLKPAFDTMVGHHLCWPGTPKDLSTLSSLYCDHHLHWKDESEGWDSKELGHTDLWKYNCKDVLSTLEITHEIRKAISILKMDELMADRMSEWELAFKMMRKGCAYDEDLRRKYRDQLAELGHTTSGWLNECMPPDLRRTNANGAWYTSPIFQREIFYDKIGLAPVLNKKTKQPTLGKESFEQILKKAPWLTPIFDRLELQRSIGVYESNFLAVKRMPNGRFGASFNIAGTETFRWSSQKNPFDEGGNFQNIPKLEEE